VVQDLIIIYLKVVQGHEAISAGESISLKLQGKRINGNIPPL